MSRKPGAEVAANPGGPKASGFFVLERGVPRVLFEEFEIFIGQRLGLFR